MNAPAARDGLAGVEGRQVVGGHEGFAGIVYFNVSTGVAMALTVVC